MKPIEESIDKELVRGWEGKGGRGEEREGEVERREKEGGGEEGGGGGRSNVGFLQFVVVVICVCCMSRESPFIFSFVVHNMHCCVFMYNVHVYM